MADLPNVRRCPICGEPMKQMKKQKKPTFLCNNFKCDVLEVVFSYVSFANMPDKKAHLRKRGLLQ